MMTLIYGLASAFHHKNTPCAHLWTAWKPCYNPLKKVQTHQYRCCARCNTTEKELLAEQSALRAPGRD